MDILILIYLRSTNGLVWLNSSQECFQNISTISKIFQSDSTRSNLFGKLDSF